MPAAAFMQTQQHAFHVQMSCNKKLLIWWRCKWRDSFLWRPRPWYSKRKYPEGYVYLESCTINAADIRCGLLPFPSLSGCSFLFFWKHLRSLTCKRMLAFIPVQCLKWLINMLILNAKDIVCCKTRPRYFEYGIQMWSPQIMRHLFHLLASLYKQIILNNTIFFS